MADTTSITVHHPNLMDIYDLTFAEGATASDYEAFVKVPAMKVELDVILPKGSDEAAASKAAGRFLSAFKKRVDKYLSEGLASIYQLHKDDQGDDEEAFGKAEGILDKLNKYLEKLTDEFRIDLRKAIAKEIGVDAKELMTMGRSKFKELKLVLGSFKNEVNLQLDNEIRTALKSKDWQNFGLAFNNKEGVIDVTGSKKISPGERKELEGNIGGAAKFLTGKLKAKGIHNIRVEILKKDDVLGADPTRKLIKKTLFKQAKGGKATQVEIVEKYTEDGDKKDKKKTKEETSEKSKEKTKEKSAQADAKSKK